ncbi:MAG: HK97 gp10 family phage protein [Candidatus Bathyarchaeia archaeon]
MAIEITCDIEGVDELKAAMQTFDSAMQKKVYQQLASWVANVIALAKQMAPVRTGHLRSSIYAKINDWVVEINAEATYALFVELGTRYMQAQPYLYPAIQEYLPQLEAIICEAVDAAKTEAGLQ